jgi:hypothetical protein
MIHPPKIKYKITPMMINEKHPQPPLPRGLLNNWLARKILKIFLIKNSVFYNGKQSVQGIVLLILVLTGEC